MVSVMIPKAGCEWMAERRGWTLNIGNVMVEGTSDVSYFTLADRLYAAETGARLIGADLSIFAAGIGNEGGTYGVSERFPALFEMASLDVDVNNKKRFKVIALLDDDKMGRVAVIGITKGHRAIVECDSIFRLFRIMPRRAGSVKKFIEKLKEENARFSGLECVIEDLISDNVYQEFILKEPHSITKVEIKVDLGVHRHFTEQGKRNFLKFVDSEAKLADVEKIVDVLRSLRSYLFLPPDGVKVYQR